MKTQENPRSANADGRAIQFNRYGSAMPQTERRVPSPIDVPPLTLEFSMIGAISTVVSMGIEVK